VRITINRRQFLSELPLLQACAERKTTIPMLAFVLVEPLFGLVKFTATDIDTTAQVEIAAETEGDLSSFCVPFSRIANLARLCEDETLTLTREGTQIFLTSGVTRQRLPSAEAKDFPLVESVQGEVIELDAQVLGSMLNALKPAISSDPNSKPEYWDVEINGKDGVLEATATDGYKLAHSELELEISDFTVLLNKRAVEAVISLCERAERVKFIPTKKAISATCGARTVTARTSLNVFPDWRLFIPVPEHVIELPEGLPAALKRASLATDRLAYAGAHFANKQLTIRSRGSEEGEGHETLSCPTVNGHDINIGINASHLIDVLRVTGKATCELSKDAENQPYLIRPQDSRGFDLYYCLVPVRLDRI
jgi:DNA polymerase III subunit beta